MQMEFDPKLTNYSNLLEMFWRNHDFTARNNRQYMSAIFYHDEEQKTLAEETMAKVQTASIKGVQTKILPAETFYDAEGYHQKYLLRRQRKIFQSLNLSEKEVITSHVAARLCGYLSGNGSVKRLREEIDSWGLNEAQKNAIFSVTENAQCSGPACGFRR